MLVELTVLAQLAAACPHVGEIPDWRVRVESKVESHRDSLAIGDNGTKDRPVHRSYSPVSLDEAVQIAGTLMAEGHRIDAGLMQINSANWERLGLTVQTVFTPQVNVCAGVHVLAEDYAAERSLERRVSCRYQTGRPDCTTPYPDLIEAERVREAGDSPVPGGTAPAIPITPPAPAPWDVYGLARAAHGLRPATPPEAVGPPAQNAVYTQR